MATNTVYRKRGSTDVYRKTTDDAGSSQETKLGGQELSDVLQSANYDLNRVAEEDTAPTPVRTGVPLRTDPSAISPDGTSPSGYTKPTFPTPESYAEYMKGTPEEQQKIADQFKAEVEANAALINAAYDKMIAGQTTVSENEAGRARALISAGQYGGPGGATSVAKTTTVEQAGKEKLANIEAQRLARLQTSLAQLTAKKEGRMDKFAAEKAGQLDKWSAMKEKELKTATDFIKNGVDTGVDFEKLKTNEPNAYKNLIDTFGGSELALQIAIDKEKKALNKDTTKYTEKVYRGENGNAYIYRYGVDPSLPAGAGFKTIDEDTGIPYNDFTQKVGTSGYEFKMSGDGQLYVVSKEPNEQGQFISVPIGGKKTPPTPKDTSVIVSGSLKTTKADIGEGEQILSQSRGEDGFTNTKLYSNAYNTWVKNGGMSTDFIKYFPPKNYLNPNDPTVPTLFKQYLKKTTTSSPASNTIPQNPGRNA